MVCQRELGIVLDKTRQKSNWSKRPLDVEQFTYAARDAEVLLALHERFANAGRIDEPGDVSQQ
jgi:ribonuclease D